MITNKQEQFTERFDSVINLSAINLRQCRGVPLSENLQILVGYVPVSPCSGKLAAVLNHRNLRLHGSFESEIRNQIRDSQDA